MRSLNTVIVLWYLTLPAMGAGLWQFDAAQIIMAKSISSIDQEILDDVINQLLDERKISITTSENPSQVLRLVLAGPHDSMISGFTHPGRWQGHQSHATETYSISLSELSDDKMIWLCAGTRRGFLYGLGHVFGQVQVSRNGSSKIHIEAGYHEPHYELRGHQLGYRNTANSWDAWEVAQYDRYIRDLVLMGSNAIEDIPFQKDEQSVHMVMPHRDMHIEISKICAKYDIDYWVWTPAPGDLSKSEIMEVGLQKYQRLLEDIPDLDAIFFPGGDPGENHPRYVLPYLKKVNKLCLSLDRDVDIWLSLQGFDSSEALYFFDALGQEELLWLTGLVHGPSSPPLAIERSNLAANYKIRLYGDITHTVRCQYPVPNWDQAFALTLGREPINPEPDRYRKVFLENMALTNGFISYSDGVHDDLNKIVWNRLGWDPSLSAMEMTRQYAKFFFQEISSDSVANGILALERNWAGPLTSNGSVETTLAWWQQLDRAHPTLRSNWRWLQFIFRAYYDAYVRHRLLFETEIERKALGVLLDSSESSVERRLALAEEILSKSDSISNTSPLADSIRSLAADLYEMVGLQTSVDKYQASGYERGAVMDFMDYPLNNRWWLADEFERIRTMRDEVQQEHAINRILTWENPGPGAYYDNVSRVGASPHVISRTDDAIDYAWWENGNSRARLSSQTFQFAPTLRYQLDLRNTYLIRVAGFGDALIRANGSRLSPIAYDKKLEGFKEFMLPDSLLINGNLEITFDRPSEGHLNWREYSKVSDVWIIPLKQ